MCMYSRHNRPRSNIAEFVCFSANCAITNEMDDIFRRFFYIPRGRDRWFDEGFHSDDSLNSRGMGDRPSDVDEKELFNFESSPADDLFVNFEQLFANLFAGRRPHSGLPVTPNEDETLSLRDRFMKRPQPGFEQPNDDDSHSGRDQDKDLDGAVSTFGLAGLNEPSHGHKSSFFSSSTITIRGVGPDSHRVEERRTSWDSDGNEETVVTRRVGDKEHRIITRRDSVGVQEQQEDLFNMDENTVKEFDAQWTSPRLESDPSSPTLEVFGGDSTAPTLFTKLFGNILPRLKPSP